MRQHFAVLFFTLSLAAHGRATSFGPWAEQRYADPDGKFAAVLIRPEGTKFNDVYGPVDLKLIRRGPSLPPLTRAEAPVDWISDINALFRFETRHRDRVLPRPGDAELGRVRLPEPPAEVLVSSRGRGAVLISNYGFTDTQKPKAVRIVSADGVIRHAMKVDDIFLPRDQWGSVRSRVFWEAAWIDDEAGTVVVVIWKENVSRTNLPAVSVIDWNTGRVRHGSLRQVEHAILTQNRSALAGAIELADKLDIRSVRRAVVEILSNAQLPPRVRARAAVYLARHGDSRAKSYLLVATKEIRRTHSNLEDSYWDYRYVVERLPGLVGANCISTLNEIGVEHGFDFTLESALQQVGREAQPALLKLLRSDKNPNAQVYAARMLSRVYSPSSEIILEMAAALSSKAASQSGELLREKAAWSFAEFGPIAKAAAPKLRLLLKDDSEKVRIAAECALKSIDPPKEAEKP